MMEKIKHEVSYVSCNCNQTPTAAHWGQNNLVCYAACNSVLIYDPKVRLCHYFTHVLIKFFVVGFWW